MKRCRDCRFVEPCGKGQRNGQDVDAGTCREPTPLIGPQSWPLIALDLDWCGQFMPKRWWQR